ncbi:O-antigen ligase family protein [Coraliomargarita akajimensis]|nr:O-antigen ligase family protein [Coraliomargarita akajimensis]
MSFLFIWRAAVRSKSIYNGPLLWLYLLWMAIYAWRLFMYSQEVAYTRHGQYEYLVMGVGMCLVPGLGFFYAWDTRRLEIALYTIAGVGSLAGWAYCWIYRAAIFGGGFGRVRGGEFIGDFVAVNPLQLGYMGSALTVVGFGLIRSKVKGWRKLLMLGVIFAPSFMLVMFSGSRGPVAALLACILLYLLVNVKRGKLAQVFAFSSFLCVLIAGAIWYGVVSESVLLERFVNTYHSLNEGGNSTSRLDMYQQAFDQVSGSLFFGDFVELREGLIYPHNFFVEALLVTGLAGLSVFVPLLIGTFVVALRLMRKYSRYGWVSLLYIHYFFYVMVSSSLYSNSYFWCSMGLVLGVWQGAKYGKIGADYEPIGNMRPRQF